MAQGRHLNERLADSGLRSTPQREQVYRVLLQWMDHPTTEEVFIRSKKPMPDISLATVYNCLDALVKCGLVRAVHLERGPTRYCSNMEEHGHFYCDRCGGVFDVGLNGTASSPALPLPKGYQVRHFEVAVHGLCPDCSSRQR